VNRNCYRGGIILLFATTMSKTRAPKHKEKYVPLDEIEEFCNEILKAGMHLASVSSVDFPDTESVSNAIAHVLSVVEGYKLVGRWVTSSVSNTEEEYVTTKEICHVSFCMFSLLINVMRNS
jgi:hypothetical protein